MKSAITDRKHCKNKNRWCIYKLETYMLYSRSSIYPYSYYFYLDLCLCLCICYHFSFCFSFCFFFSFCFGSTLIQSYTPWINSNSNNETILNCSSSLFAEQACHKNLIKFSSGFPHKHEKSHLHHVSKSPLYPVNRSVRWSSLKI